jgi:hypothetical protein
MKLSNVATFMRFKAVRILAAATLAGAFFAAGAPVARAQQFAVGVQFGAPRYVAPAYSDRGYYERQRFEEQRRHDEWVRQQEFNRHERFDRDHRYDRDHYRR